MWSRKTMKFQLHIITFTKYKELKKESSEMVGRANLYLKAINTQ
jgi:hypothetical protein